MQNNLKRIMLIDDNVIDLKINAKIINLTKLFDEVILCESGHEALDYLIKNLQNDNKKPDFILLDIQMPEMDGFEFLEHFKKFDRSFTDNCPVAMLSSTLDFGDIQRAEANLYVLKLLKKPLNPKDLTALIS